MQPFSAPLRDHPQAKQLLENQAAIRQMLANPETQKLLRSLQKKNAGQLKSAAQSALQGDTAATLKCSTSWPPIPRPNRPWSSWTKP